MAYTRWREGQDEVQGHAIAGILFPDRIRNIGGAIREADLPRQASWMRSPAR